jgi:hypothetical protein
MTNDRLPIDPADPEYELKVAEQYQAITNGPQRWDNEPVQITVRQAQKMSAIMSAVANGHESYVDALRAASWFLDCARAEAEPSGAIGSSMTAAEAWERVDAWPWPRSGKPRSQQL